jgi:hypothetical protein
LVVSSRRARGERAYVDIFCLVFVGTTVTVIIIAVPCCGARTFAALCRCKERTFCRYRARVRLLWKNLELS